MKHGLVAHVEAYYYVPVKQEKRGRKRKVGRRGKGGSGHYPLLSRLGVVANASPALCEDVVVEVLRESYEEAHEALVRAGVNISIKRMRTINIALGRRAVKLRNAKVADNEVEDSCAGKTIAVSVDGGRTLIRTNSKGRPLSSGYHRFDAEWREPKLFTIYEVDDKGRKQKKGVVRCDGTFGGPDTLVELLAAELRRLDAANAARVVFLGDGARWIWNRIDDIAGKAHIVQDKVLRCLDYYHAVEHLAKIAEAKSFPSPKERKKWLKNMKKLLKTSTPQQFLDELKKAKCRGNHIIKCEYEYFSKNRNAIGYAQLSKNNLPIGSGAIESAVRRVVNLRIKGAGIFWHIENAEAILHMRSQLKSGNWNKFFDYLLSNQVA